MHLCTSIGACPLIGKHIFPFSWVLAALAVETWASELETAQTPSPLQVVSRKLPLDGVLWDSCPWFGMLLGSLTGEPAAGFELRLREGANVISLMRESGIPRSRFLARAAGCAGSLGLFGGVRETLDILRQRQVPMGVASSLPQGLVVPILDGLRLLNRFTEVVHAGNCRAHKPNPGPILQALGGMGVRPSPDVFYVGDRDVDGVAAARARVSFAWAAYGYGHPPPVEHVVLDRFADLLRL